MMTDPSTVWIVVMKGKKSYPCQVLIARCAAPKAHQATEIAKVMFPELTLIGVESEL